MRNSPKTQHRERQKRLKYEKVIKRYIEDRCENSNVLLTRILEEKNRETGRVVPFEAITCNFSELKESHESLAPKLLRYILWV